MNEIIVSDTVYSLKERDVEINQRLVREFGLYIIKNKITNEYEFLQVHQSLQPFHVFMTTGTLTKISNENWEYLVRDLNTHINAKDKLKFIRSKKV